MDKSAYIGSVTCLLFFAVGANAQGDVVVHKPPGLDILFKKQAKVTTVRRKQTSNTITANAPAIAAVMPPHTNGSKPLAEENVAVGANANVVVSKPHFVHIAKPERIIYSGKGFRVQVYYGEDRNKAEKIKKELMADYPDLRAYLTYYPPYFRVKIGNYRNRADALGMLKKANAKYSPSMIVPDNVVITTF